MFSLEAEDNENLGMIVLGNIRGGSSEKQLHFRINCEAEVVMTKQPEIPIRGKIRKAEGECKQGESCNG